MLLNVAFSELKMKKGKVVLTNRGSISLDCQECNHHFVYFYCWSCDNRLIKNGRYWNYHSSHATEPFDIKCPHCGRYWYQMGNQREQNAQ